jgi:hypothetical protein
MRPTMIIDEGDHGLDRRSNSASQNKRSPCAGSRWPAEAYGSPVPGLQPPGNLSRNADPLPTVDLGLLDSVIESLRCAADLGRNRCHHRSARRRLAGVIQSNPNRTVPDLRRKLVRRLACHGSILSGVGAFRQTPGGSGRYLHQQYYGCDRCNENGFSRQRHGYTNRASAQEARKGVEDESRYVRKYASTRTSMSSFSSSRTITAPFHWLASNSSTAGRRRTTNWRKRSSSPRERILVWSGSKSARNAAHMPSRARRVSQVKDKERHQLRIDLVPPQRRLSAP